MAEGTGKFIDCPTCGAEVEIKIAKTKKPYYHCGHCGTQTFVRFKEGIEKLMSKSRGKEVSKDEDGGGNSERGEKRGGETEGDGKGGNFWGADDFN